MVDDNSVNQMVVQALLKKDGHEVTLASDGAQAVDGELATRTIRRLEGSPPRNVPIVALTASAMIEDVQRCLAAGMNDHLSKPVDRELLRKAIIAWTMLIDGMTCEAPGPTVFAAAHLEIQS